MKCIETQISSGCALTTPIARRLFSFVQPRTGLGHMTSAASIELWISATPHYAQQASQYLAAQLSLCAYVRSFKMTSRSNPVFLQLPRPVPFALISRKLSEWVIGVWIATIKLQNGDK